MKTLRNLFNSPDFPCLILFAVSPLFFFTDLTRNPYQIQIALLNLSLLWVSSQRFFGFIREPKHLLEWSSSEIAFLTLILWAGVTCSLSWAVHPLFRPSIFHEGLKGWLFIVINGYLAFQLGRGMGQGRFAEEFDVPISKILWAALIWAALWVPFHQLRAGDNAVWDSYGAFVWGVLLFASFRLLKPGSAAGGLGMTFFACAIAGGYSIVQFFGRDIIWGGLLDPYGGRPISTFGNPNFLSSYLVMMLPVAAVLAACSSRNRDRISSGILCLLIGGSLLCSSTRSSWVGALAALGVLYALCRNSFDERQKRTARMVALSGLAVFVLWLASPWRALALEPLARARELFVAIKTGHPYPALNQRFLMWRCAWDMIQKSPLCGMGWGCFELFYPFFQGPLLFNPTLNFRTHANNAHNPALELGAQMGLVGLGLSCWLLVIIFRTVWGARRRGDMKSRLFISGILAGCLGMIVDNIFGNVSLFFAAPAFLFWWLLGLANGMAAEPVIMRLNRPKAGRLLAALLLMGSLGTGVWIVQRFRADESYFLGFKLSKGGKTAQAIPLLENSSRIYPFLVDNAYELGICHAEEARLLQTSQQPDLARREHEKAIEAYRLAIAAQPGYDEIYYNLGTELAAIGQLNEAFDNLKISLWLNPLYRNGYTMLASLGVALPQRHDETLALLEDGLVFYPGDIDLANDVGYFLVTAGRLEEARQTFQKCLDINPQSAIARNNLNNVLRQIRQSQKPPR